MVEELSATVTLTPWEYKACMDVAAARMATSNEAGWNHGSTYKRTYLQRTQEEIVGVCGEMAVARVLDCYWSPSVNTFHKETDLPRSMEVRSTAHLTGRLIVRENDPTDRIYVLVIGEPPTMTVVGWMLGADARKDQWIENPHGHRQAWFVPQDQLIPINHNESTPHPLEPKGIHEDHH